MAVLGSRLVPLLKARDLRETIEWYTERLGFCLSGRAPAKGGEPYWCELQRDGVTLMFTNGGGPFPGPPQMTGTLYFYPDDVLALYAELAGRVELEWGPEEMSYGMREFGIRDCNGYYLAFAEPVDDGAGAGA